MSKKIMGVTVGTSLSPSKIEEKIKPIKTVNNVAPDENGNMEIKIPEGANGKTPYIQDGYWYIDGVNTEVKAEGVDGKDGAKGDKGDKGEQGEQGIQGIQGVQGEKGDKGDKGDTGADGKDGTNGKDGANGTNGKDGVSATHSWNGTTLTITSASGTSSANLKGDKGDKGDTGAQGIQGEKGDKGDTGATGAKGDKGDTYTLTSSDKTEIANAVLAETGIDVIPNYVKTEAESVIERVLSAQRNRTFTFAVMTDMHYGNGSYTDGIKHACQAMKYIDERVKLDTIAILGDYTDGYPSTGIADAMADFKGINAMLDKLRFAPNLRQMGNHDYYADNIPITRRLIQYYSDDVVWGSKIGGYFYKDYEDIKLRIISLNTNEINPIDTSNNHPSSSISITVDQCNWFINTLDMSGKDNAGDWQILILSHQPLDWWTYDNVNRLSYIVNAYQKGATWTDSTVSCDFTGKNKAKIVGNIHGHIHNLLHEPMFLGVANNATKTSVYRWATPNACYNRENQYDGVWQEPTTYSKTRNSAKDTSFVIYCLDLETYTMKAICYGAGYDRETTYAEIITFTNALPLSISSDGSPYNGGQGWKTNTRLNSSGAEAELTNWEATGFIKISGTSKIYFKNIDWNSDGASKDYFAIYDSSFAKIASDPFTGWVNTNGADIISQGKIQKDANGNITYLDVSCLPIANYAGAGKDFGSRIAYFRMSACGITNDSIISIDNPIE